MPLADSDPPFVGAAVGATQPISLLTDLRGNPAELLRRIQAVGGTPWICQVVPYPGYAAAVQPKYELMNRMAGLRLSVTGRHGYLPPGGFSARNMVWGHCLSQTVVQLVIWTLFREPVVGLEVAIDQKTLAVGERQLVRDKLLEIPRHFREQLASMEHLDPPRIRQLIGRIQLETSAIRVRWSDEPGESDAADGLRLAHWLARHYRRHLIRPRRSSFHELLAETGWGANISDVTEFVAAPPDPDSLSRWQQDTGLPLPEACTPSKPQPRA